MYLKQWRQHSSCSIWLHRKKLKVLLAPLTLLPHFIPLDWPELSYFWSTPHWELLYHLYWKSHKLHLNSLNYSACQLRNLHDFIHCHPIHFVSPVNHLLPGPHLLLLLLHQLELLHNRQELQIFLWQILFALFIALYSFGVTRYHSFSSIFKSIQSRVLYLSSLPLLNSCPAAYCKTFPVPSHCQYKIGLVLSSQLLCQPILKRLSRLSVAADFILNTSSVLSMHCPDSGRALNDLHSLVHQYQSCPFIFMPFCA